MDVASFVTSRPHPSPNSSIINMMTHKAPWKPENKCNGLWGNEDDSEDEDEEDYGGINTGEEFVGNVEYNNNKRKTIGFVWQLRQPSRNGMCQVRLEERENLIRVVW